jgi:hypothetical protein
MHVWAKGGGHISLVTEQYDKFYSYPVFHNSSITGQCLANMNVPAPKIKALWLDPKTHNGDFLKYGCNNFD